MANKNDTEIKEDDPYLRWLHEARGLSETTISHYNSYYKHFVKGELSQTAINSFLMNKKNNSVVRGFMKSFLQYCGLTDRFLIPPKKTGKKKKRIIRDFSPNQIKKVKDYSYKVSFGGGLLFDLLYYGALRKIEIMPLKTNSFDWATYFNDPKLNKHCKLLVYGKGKKQREVLIPPIVMNKLLEKYFESGLITHEMDVDVWINTLTSDVSQLLDGIYSRNINRIIGRNSLKVIGIAIRPHELRHTRATELEKQGASIRSVQHYLGHSSPQITEIYLHTTQTQSLQKMMDVVND